MIGGDLVVTAGAKTLGLMTAGRTGAVVNAHEIITGDFTRNRDFRLPADRLRLSLEARLREGVARRSLTPAELGGGTFTISNLGMYGVDSFTAIINPPQGAILAIGRTVEKPVGRDGQIVLRPMANFTLSSDHRIIDGVTAARFMADLREALENPEVLL